MYLVEINNQRENNIVEGIIEAVELTTSANYFLTYLGMDSINRADPNDFYWYPSGLRHRNGHFSCFADGEPNRGDEFCVGYYRKPTASRPMPAREAGCTQGRGWADIVCERKENILCEK